MIARVLRMAAITAVVTGVLLWAAGSFLTMEPNPAHWFEGSRFGFMLLVCIAAIFAAGWEADQ